MNGWTGDDISGFHESASSAREGFGIGDHFGALVTGDIPAKPPTSDNDVALFSSTHARRLSRPDATRPALPRRTSSQVRALFIRAREIVEAVESEDEVQLCNSLSSLLAVCGETYEHDSELDPFHQTVRGILLEAAGKLLTFRHAEPDQIDFLRAAAMDLSLDTLTHRHVDTLLDRMLEVRLDPSAAISMPNDYESHEAV